MLLIPMLEEDFPPVIFTYVKITEKSNFVEPKGYEPREQVWTQ